MQRIEIGRYPVPAQGWSGYVEGTRDDGSTWIMFLDSEGSPAQFYSRREGSGAVIGDPVALTT
ncbi:hypothetical protein [Mycobacteroides abscessus]|uniref:hypothetical protein n=1 Tax=Mycobacteroides abscessus TaxID=36809 RepID=UPI00092BF5BD|nr:hypothetical protein [Mycobacteroides abscessus]QSM04891.1 hypothetical protein PROPHIGD91-4_40 [Mycobacterium phage prophi91-4]MDO3335138.1 hypothetical protein [Mycobacteroides abscessus subsp. bolletii]QSM87826.1 hypothetical protein I3U44_18690 [Mycobacteroides abscessus subsp. bolletii]SIB01306.1 Uncharacterised protein [Mycobacteroides abscessus subsp. bolletii]SII69765.1 Uncharacterised protein [Mycobacteroides abscessus subsp. bolletii]